MTTTTTACADKVGTHAGYNRHLRADQTPCAECRQAEADHCRAKYRRQRGPAERTRRAEARRARRRLIDCATCGKLVETTSAQRRYCSRACSRATARKRGRARPPGISGPAWKKLRAQVFSEETTCWICGEHVHHELEHPHPRSHSVDHLQPVDQGGSSDRSNLRLAHLRCNQQRWHREKGR